MQLTQTLPNSVLSAREDGFGFHYGHVAGDCRQINVRQEGDLRGWVAYIAGACIGTHYKHLHEAEQAALAWIRENPEA